jgi:hypothetical protein
MQAVQYSNRVVTIAAMLIITVTTSCKKLLEIDPPIGSISTVSVFSANDQAQSAMAGVYTRLINGANPNMSHGDQGFAMGATSIFCALSADDYYYTRTDHQSYYNLYLNKLNEEQNTNTSMVLWTSAYDCIYGCNAILEGIAQSKSLALTQPVRDQLNGEAKFLRAFSFFYLINLFGDVPLTLTTDFNETRLMKRTPVTQVYARIVADLTDAIALLPADYISNSGERIRPNKAVAKAMLARVSLYLKDYAKAAQLAGELISQADKYDLETDLNNAFLINSKEVIWQLQHSNMASPHGSSTPEATILMNGPIATTNYFYLISPQLEAAYETGDQRKVKWMVNNGSGKVAYKYKNGQAEGVVGGTPTEYNVPLRLSEQLLIRAEALLLGPAADKNGALADLNTIRRRAGLTTDLPNTLTNEQVKEAIMHERQVELFGEWGHRWLDLKRTGQAETVLGAIPAKQPWAGNFQLLYPIPLQEITSNPNLDQNPRY